MHRIGGRLGTAPPGGRGAAVGIPLLRSWDPNPRRTAGTVAGGQFDWGGRLPKGNGGAQRYSQNGWESFGERKRRRVPDCETDGSSRDESRR